VAAEILRLVTSLVSINVKTKKVDMKTVLSGSSQTIVQCPPRTSIINNAEELLDREASNVMGLQGEAGQHGTGKR